MIERRFGSVNEAVKAVSAQHSSDMLGPSGVPPANEREARTDRVLPYSMVPAVRLSEAVAFAPMILARLLQERPLHFWKFPIDVVSEAAQSLPKNSAL